MCSENTTEVITSEHDIQFILERMDAPIGRRVTMPITSLKMHIKASNIMPKLETLKTNNTI
jgi:hypothetical protein